MQTSSDALPRNIHTPYLISGKSNNTDTNVLSSQNAAQQPAIVIIQSALKIPLLRFHNKGVVVCTSRLPFASGPSFKARAVALMTKSFTDMGTP
jgi:hypothetical protein